MKDFWPDIKFFKPSEFASPEDPESGKRMNHWLVMFLDDLAWTTGRRIIIHKNGGYSITGHSEGSFHYKGMASDFHFGSSRYLPNSDATPWDAPLSQQARIILGLGKFGGVGIYPEWNNKGFHVDVRPGFQVWTKRKGTYLYLFG